MSAPEVLDVLASRQRVARLPERWAIPVAEFASQQLLNGFAASYVDTNVLHVLRLAEARPLVDPWQITPSLLQAWLRLHNWSRSTRSHVLVALRAFYQFGMATGRVGRSPVSGLQIDHAQPGPRRKSFPAWDEPIADYLLSLRAAGRRPTTIEQRRRLLLHVAAVQADPWEVTTNDLTVFLSTDGWSQEYRRSHLSAVRSFYRWAHRVGRVQVNPAEHLPAVMIHRSLPRPIPTEQLQLAMIRADDRQRLILQLAAYAGLRRAEVAGLTFSDVHHGQVLVRGKGGHQRWVPLHPDLQDALDAERGRRRAGLCGEGHLLPIDADPDPDGPVFLNRRGEAMSPDSIAEVAGQVLPTGWTLHTLRHRFATKAYHHQRDLRAVQELLGHAKPETTARYAAVPDGAKRSAVMSVGL